MDKKELPSMSTESKKAEGLVNYCPNCGSGELVIRDLGKDMHECACNGCGRMFIVLMNNCLKQR